MHTSSQNAIWTTAWIAVVNFVRKLQRLIVCTNAYLPFLDVDPARNSAVTGEDSIRRAFTHSKGAAEPITQLHNDALTETSTGWLEATASDFLVPTPRIAVYWFESSRFGWCRRPAFPAHSTSRPRWCWPSSSLSARHEKVATCRQNLIVHVINFRKRRRCMAQLCCHHCARVTTAPGSPLR